MNFALGLGGEILGIAVNKVDLLGINTTAVLDEVDIEDVNIEVDVELNM